MQTTIFALSSARGQAGVAVIRISGDRALEAVRQLTHNKVPAFRKAGLRRIFDPESGVELDQALVLLFQGPASFTGEDCAELHVHGGRAVIDGVLQALAKIESCIPALPGEFTRRAFENGKMDLTEAEGIADLIHAETALQREQALRQMGGGLFTLYQEWADSLSRALAHLEADIDFPDEDLPDGVRLKVLPQLQKIQKDILGHLNDGRRGERLRDGVHVAVIGAPNAGKSSLINAIAQRDVAIVSPVAGTTRDVIDVPLDLNGYPIIISDTAGLRPDALGRDDQDQIESEGIRRAFQKAKEAELKLLLFNAEDLPVLDPHTLDLCDENALVCLNKSDLVQGCETPSVLEPYDPVWISAQTQDGLDHLLKKLTEKAEALIGVREAPALTRTRHRQALSAAHDALSRAMNASLPELMAEDVRLALRELGRITGRVDVEDLLDVIFRDFCIGK